MSDGCHILVVDDDPEDQFILLEYFREFGIDHYIKFLDNGQKAVEYLQDCKVNISLPKLVVLDLNMPILNGSQTLLHIKRDILLRHVPVIIYSTSDNEIEKRKCLSFGAAEYLVKPLTYDEGQKLVAKFSAYLGD